MFVGFKSVRQLAMAVGVFDMFVGKTDKDSLRRRGWWRNSLDAAICSRELSTKFPGLVPDEAYTCGLLHLIGKTILDRFEPVEYEKVDLLLEHGATDRQAEKAVFGCDHIDIAMASAKKWGFPDVLIGGLNYQNADATPGDDRRLGALISISDAISHLAVEGGAENREDADKLPMWAMNTLQIPCDQSDNLIHQGMAAISAAAKMGI